jgi:hypothetical protein
MLSQIVSKIYRAGGTQTGRGMNSTTDKIIAGNFKNGIPKIMVVMTDGASYDSIV